MSFTNDLFNGIADHLVTAGIGVKVTTGKFQSTDIAIVMQTLPQEPDTAIALTTYTVSDDPTLSDSVYAVQAMMRGADSDPRPLNDLADSVFDALQNFTGTLSTGICVQQMVRRSSALLGKDQTQRWLRSDNYYAQLWRPSTYRS